VLRNIIEWFLFVVLGVGVWACGSAFVAAYVERYQHEKGDRNYDWFDDATGVLLVVLWPVTVPLVAPFFGAHKFGTTVFNRIHRAELITDELAGKNDSGFTSVGGPHNGTAYINFHNTEKGRVQAVTIPIHNSYGNINLNNPMEVTSVDVTVQ